MNFFRFLKRDKKVSSISKKKKTLQTKLNELERERKKAIKAAGVKFRRKSK